MLVPLTDLIDECGETKAIKHTGTKKSPCCWDKSHQKAFEDVKNTVGRDVMLAYPDYLKLFEIYTDMLTRQLGAVVLQNNRPIAFFVVN